MKNPIKDKKGYYRVFRGGGWYSVPEVVRASYRDDYDGPSYQNDNLGFRIVRNNPKDKK
jgi:formylglycine-generating enzyme required for sulfatase activity